MNTARFEVASLSFALPSDITHASRREALMILMHPSLDHNTTLPRPCGLVVKGGSQPGLQFACCLHLLFPV